MRIKLRKAFLSPPRYSFIFILRWCWWWSKGGKSTGKSGFQKTMRFFLLRESTISRLQRESSRPPKKKPSKPPKEDPPGNQKKTLWHLIGSPKLFFFLFFFFGFCSFFFC